MNTEKEEFIIQDTNENERLDGEEEYEEDMDELFSMDLGNDNLKSKGDLKYFEESGKKINPSSFGRVDETCNMPMETLVANQEPK